MPSSFSYSFSYGTGSQAPASVGRSQGADFFVAAEGVYKFGGEYWRNAVSIAKVSPESVKYFNVYTANFDGFSSYSLPYNLKAASIHDGFVAISYNDFNGSSYRLFGSTGDLVSSGGMYGYNSNIRDANIIGVFDEPGGGYALIYRYNLIGPQTANRTFLAHFNGMGVQVGVVREISSNPQDYDQFSNGNFISGVKNASESIEIFLFDGNGDTLSNQIAHSPSQGNIVQNFDIKAIGDSALIAWDEFDAVSGNYKLKFRIVTQNGLQATTYSSDYTSSVPFSQIKVWEGQNGIAYLSFRDDYSAYLREYKIDLNSPLQMQLITLGQFSQSQRILFQDDLNVAITNGNAVDFYDLASLEISNSGQTQGAFFTYENVLNVGVIYGASSAPAKILTYSITGGADAALFAIDSSTGALSFKSAPNFEAPADAGSDNVYDILVQVSDGSLIDAQAIAVTVSDVTETPASSILIGTVGVDTLSGNGGIDVIYGLGGVDIMNGAGDSDFYLITGSAEHKAAEITDTGASGTDEVRFSAAKSDTLKIFAGDTGIESVVIGTGTGAAADSSGTLSLNIDASKAVNALTLIGNAGVNKLTGTAFNDTIDGGLGADKLTGGAGDDTYIVDNVKDGISEKATGGTDTAMSSVGYTLAMNVENLTLTGAANIGGTGNKLNNTITGNDGNNTLVGGLGNDTISGGAGADLFVFNTQAITVTNVDTITDFSSSDGDHLQFSLKLFKALGAVGDLTSDQFWSGAGVTTAHDATDRLIYNTTSGNLYYDPDGVAVRYAAVLVAHLSGSPALAYGDIQIIA